MSVTAINLGATGIIYFSSFWPRSSSVLRKQGTLKHLFKGDTMTEISAKKTLQMTSSIGVQAPVKHSFSKQHFRTARYFAAVSAKIENENKYDTEDENIKSIHRSYVTGAIFSSVAGLESSINELYLEACDKNNNTLQGLDENDLDKIAEWWNELERSSILLKYQMALMLANHNKFDHGTQPYQDVDSLIQLRNALVHYKPEWDTESQKHENLRKRLNLKFILNPFASKSRLWFPHKCLGSGCVLWSINASEVFITSFCKKMSITNRV